VKDYSSTATHESWCSIVGFAHSFSSGRDNGRAPRETSRAHQSARWPSGTQEFSLLFQGFPELAQVNATGYTQVNAMSFQLRCGHALAFGEIKKDAHESGRNKSNSFLV
jgi:hypothetical protein